MHSTGGGGSSCTDGHGPTSDKARSFGRGIRHPPVPDRMTGHAAITGNAVVPPAAPPASETGLPSVGLEDPGRVVRPGFPFGAVACVAKNAILA